MKFRLTVLIVFSLCLSNVFADEGMWLLGNLRKNKQTDQSFTCGVLTNISILAFVFRIFSGSGQMLYKSR